MIAEPCPVKPVRLPLTDQVYVMFAFGVTEAWLPVELARTESAFTPLTTVVIVGCDAAAITATWVVAVGLCVPAASTSSQLSRMVPTADGAVKVMKFEPWPAVMTPLLSFHAYV